MVKWISSLPSKQMLGVRISPEAPTFMKKLFFIILAALILFSLPITVTQTQAAQCSVEHPDTSSTVTPRPNAAGHPEVANSLVPCGQYPDCQCELQDLFTMVLRIYNFLVWTIATPLAGLLVVAGGVLMVVSGGNPGLLDWGKRILWGVFIAIILIFGSWFIIDIVLKAIGYTGRWNTF